MFGGRGEGRLFDDIWEYDQARGTYRGPLVSPAERQQLEEGSGPLPVPAPRYDHAAADAGAYMVVMGGQSSRDMPVSCQIGLVCSDPTRKTYSECYSRALVVGAPYFALSDPNNAPSFRDERRALCCLLTASESGELPVGGRVPRDECIEEVDDQNRPLGTATRSAVYSSAHVNQSYMNDVWLWRYPQLPWQPIATRDGTPRAFEEVGDSLPW